VRLSSGRKHGTSTLYTSSSTRVIARMTHQVCFTSSHSETNISQTTYGFSISEKCCFVFVCGLQEKTPASTAALLSTKTLFDLLSRNISLRCTIPYPLQFPLAAPPLLFSHDCKSTSTIDTRILLSSHIQLKPSSRVHLDLSLSAVARYPSQNSRQK
jgi:hypothetical protein